MGYPQYQPQGVTHYPPPNPPDGERPPGPCPPQRKSMPGWVPALAAVGAVLLLGMAAGVVGGSGEEKSDALASTSASAATIVPAHVRRAVPATENPVPAVPPPAAVQVEPPAVTTETASAVMPGVVCMNLQDAQDLIQAAGVFFSRSTDATGAGRRQVLDRNWVVVAQTPAPGALIGEGDAVLSVVKIGEPNRCR